MARPVIRKCLDCSQLTIDQARQLHGPNGDNCWEEKLCHRRRSHYRNRKDNNAKRRGQYAQIKAATAVADTVKSIVVPVQAPAVALLYLYREKRQDAHLHALSVALWRGDDKLADIEPIHCLGMTNRQVNEYLKRVLAIVRDRFGITEFEPPIRMEPSECPLMECPLKDRYVR